MKKDKFGISIKFYVVLAFALTALGQTLLCALLAAALIFVVQDEWAARNGLQAFFVALLSAVISTMFAGLNVFAATPFIGAAFAALSSVLSGIFNLIPFVLAIIGIVKAAKGKEANIPLFASWARRAYGITEQKVYNYTDNNQTPAQ